MTPSPSANGRWTLPSDDLRLRVAGASAFEMAQRLVDEGKGDRKARPWVLGAEGEVLAAGALAGLPMGWTVLHDVPVGLHGANIDHVVFGPAGVFTINTKHHKGRHVSVSGTETWVDGRNHPHVEKALGEADRASALLSRAAGFPVYVQSVLLFVGSRSLNVGDELVAGLTVASEHDVCRLLARGADTIAPHVLEGLVAVAARPEVWAQRTDGVGPQALKASIGAGKVGVPGGPKRVFTHRVSASTRNTGVAVVGHQSPVRAHGRLGRLLRVGLGSLFVACVLGVAVSEIPKAYDEAFPPTQTVTPSAGTDTAPVLVDVGSRRKFVLAVRDRFPTVTSGVSGPALGRVAENVCSAFAEPGVGLDRDAALLDETSQSLRDPKRSQVVKVIRLAVSVGCPTYKADVSGLR